jgi:hypothetical protein
LAPEISASLDSWGVADHAKVNLHEVDVLSICLPPETWVANKGTLEDELSIIRDNGEEYVFDRVDLHAQGVGALGCHAMTGADPEEGELVLDIGGNTILALRYDRVKVKTDSIISAESFFERPVVVWIFSMMSALVIWHIL